MEAKSKKTYTSRFTKFEGNNDYLDFDKYEDLVEEGYHDREIAKELNVNMQFLEGMKKDMNKEY
jgi:phage shock protein A